MVHGLGSSHGGRPRVPYINFRILKRAGLTFERGARVARRLRLPASTNVVVGLFDALRYAIIVIVVDDAGCLAA